MVKMRRDKEDEEGTSMDDYIVRCYKKALCDFYQLCDEVEKELHCWGICY